MKHNEIPAFSLPLHFWQASYICQLVPNPKLALTDPNTSASRRHRIRISKQADVMHALGDELFLDAEI